MIESRRILGACALAALAFVWTGCANESSVQFAAILPLSGPVEAYGTAIERGIELALEEAQANKGLELAIELEILDSETDPERAARLLERKYEEGAVAAIGGVTSPEAFAMVEIADEEDRVLLSPSASSPDLTGMSRNFFRVFPSDFVEGTKMGNFAANTLKLETVVIIASESPYGAGIQGVFEEEFERHGGEVLETLEYPENTSDFSGFVGRLVTLSPDAVYLAAYWRDLVALMEQIEDAGYEGKVLTTSAFATPTGVAAAGEHAEGVYFTQTVFDLTSDSEPIRSFVDSFRRKYGEDPDLYAAHGYDAMKILVEAAVEGGTTPNGIWKGMRGIRSFPGVTGSIQFDERGDVAKFPRVYVIREGSPINYEDHVRQVKEAFRQRLQELEEQQRKLRQGQGGN